MKLVIASDIHGAADWCERLMAAIEADSRPEWHGPDAPRRALRVIRDSAW